MSNKTEDKTIQGLSETLRPGGKELRKQKGNWGNPNRKIAKKIAQRRDDYDKMMASNSNLDPKAFHRPGSHKG
jgi:hypothetical protein